MPKDEEPPLSSARETTHRYKALDSSFNGSVSFEEIGLRLVESTISSTEALGSEPSISVSSRFETRWICLTAYRSF